MENNSVDSEKYNFAVFRYKIDPDLVELLSRFSIEHQFDNRHDFKEAWTKWKEIHQEYFDKEEQRIKQLNYKGDVEVKLYKAARYYYRNKFSLEKKLDKDQYTDSETQKHKREYITLQNDFLIEIDNHIKKNIKDKHYTPANGYHDFCNNNIELIKKEIEELLRERNDLGVEFIITKIKKAYKNRYYQFKKYN
tara:strand:+ start:921 stop:1499 length:579 start_codon:yes stop_codon:yes gene_type:complete